MKRNKPSVEKSGKQQKREEQEEGKHGTSKNDHLLFVYDFSKCKLQRELFSVVCRVDLMLAK